jgi:hypothetical protein
VDRQTLSRAIGPPRRSPFSCPPRHDVFDPATRAHHGCDGHCGQPIRLIDPYARLVAFHHCGEDTRRRQTTSAAKVSCYFDPLGSPLAPGLITDAVHWQECAFPSLISVGTAIHGSRILFATGIIVLAWPWSGCAPGTPGTQPGSVLVHRPADPHAHAHTLEHASCRPLTCIASALGKSNVPMREADGSTHVS